jgi:hypothetical protein
MALTQIRQDTAGRTYYLRKRTQATGHKEATRCLKRRLSDVVFRQLRRDAARRVAGPYSHVLTLNACEHQQPPYS